MAQTDNPPFRLIRSLRKGEINMDNFAMFAMGAVALGIAAFSLISRAKRVRNLAHLRARAEAGDTSAQPRAHVLNG